MLNSDDVSPLLLAAIMIIEYAGKYMDREGWEEVNRKLLSLCTKGSVKLSKHAVRSARFRSLHFTSESPSALWMAIIRILVWGGGVAGLS